MLTKERKIRINKIEASKIPPIDLNFVKSYLNIANNSEDDLLLSIMNMTTDYAEWFMEKSLMPQKWEVSYFGILHERLFLPFGPIANIDTISIINDDVISLTSSQYKFDASMSCVTILAPIYYSRLDIKYSTGYSDVNLIPQQIKNGILMHTLMVYKNRSIYSGANQPDLSQVKANYFQFRELKLVL